MPNPVSIRRVLPNSAEVAAADPTPPAEGLFAYYKAGVGLTYDGANAVSQWDDQETGHHITAVTGSKQPLRVEEGYAGYDTVRFDGVLNDLSSPSFTSEPEFTVFLVFKMITYVHQDYIFDGYSQASETIYMKSPSPQIGTYAGGYGPANSDLAVGTWGVLTVKFASGAGLSGVQVNDGTMTMGNIPSPACNGIKLGAGAGPANIEVAELLCYNEASDSDKIAAVTAYTNNKFSIY